MSSNHPVTQASARSPFAGCAIFITAFLVMVFLIGFSVLTLFRQFNEIARFTSEKPSPVAVSPIENQEAALNALAGRIELFRQVLGSDQAAELALTPEEINLAIAAYEPFKDLRGTFRLLSADEGVLRIAISFPLNGKPRLARGDEPGWVASDARYLNGTLLAKPGLLKREVVLQVDHIEVPGAAVPREFIDQMSPYRITERYLADPVLGPAMAKLTRVEVKEGRLLMAKTPGEVPADLITDAEVDRATGKFFTFLAVAACLFLAFAGTMIFIGLRAKARRSLD